jgi:2-dehydro-3-deoxygalactonokinase
VYCITIDTGTTNSRITLWENEKAVDKVSREIGVRNTAIDGNNSRLKNAVKECIDEILDKNNLDLDKIQIIMASGMITSNVGLVEIPHLWAPAGIDELSDGMVSKYLPDVVKKEIWFVPGIKNNIREVTLDNCEAMDIMRGEEVETIGLLKRLNIKEPTLMILPGSHSKFVSVDKDGKITGCLTSLAGELISVITHNTIIASALENSMASSFNKEMVLRGYENGKKAGLNRVLFTVRIIDQFTDYSVNDKANFLIGTVLSADLQAMKESTAIKADQDSNVVITGKDILRDSFVAILKEDNYFNNVVATKEEDTNNLAGFGVLSIAKHRGLI